MVELSIIIPVYNVEKYVQQCLNSVAVLPVDRFEIIIVDDGSTDDSPQICDMWAVDRRNVIVIHEENEGVSVARNIGIERAHGKYILFLDGDDWIDAAAVENALSTALQEKLDILIGSFYCNMAESEYKQGFFTFTEHVFSQEERLVLLQNCLVPCGFANKKVKENCGVPWAKLYAADFIRKEMLSFVPGLKRMQDTIFNMEAFMCAEKIQCVGVAFYHYRVSRNAATNKYTPDFYATAKMVMREAKKVLEEYRVSELCKNVFCAKGIYLFLETTRLQLVMDQSKTRTQKNEELCRLASDQQISSYIKSCPFRLLDFSGKMFLCLLRFKMYGPIIKIMGYRARRKREIMYE